MISMRDVKVIEDHVRDKINQIYYLSSSTRERCEILCKVSGINVKAALDLKIKDCLRFSTCHICDAMNSCNCIINKIGIVLLAS